MVPEVYAVGTATEAESAYKGVEAGGGISYDAAYNKGNYVVAVGAGHGFYVLAHEATAFIYVRGVAAFLAFIFAFSWHYCIVLFFLKKTKSIFFLDSPFSEGQGCTAFVENPPGFP